MLVVITSWYGRLGNNILQVLNAIIDGGGTIIIPKHPHFHTEMVKCKGDSSGSSIRRGVYYPDFYCRMDYHGSDIINMTQSKHGYGLTFGMYHYTCKKNLRLFLNVNILPKPHPGIVIYFRSSDIWDAKCNRSYIPNPSSMIIKIVQQHLERFAGTDDDLVTVVCEDTLSPNIEEVRKIAPNFRFVSSTVIEDWTVLANAKIICGDYSTFMLTALMMNNFVEEFHCTDHCYKLFPDMKDTPFDCYVWSVEGYIKPGQKPLQQGVLEEMMVMEYPCECTKIEKNLSVTEWEKHGTVKGCF